MGGRRPARRQDRHLAVRRARPHRRGRRRLPHTGAARGRLRRAGRSPGDDLTAADRCERSGVARPAARHPRRDRARGARRDPPVRHDLAAELARQAAGRDRAVAPAPPTRTTRSAARPGPIRRRGTRSPRRLARRQHLRHRHRPIEPDGGTAVRRTGRQPPQSVAGRHAGQAAGTRRFARHTDLRRAPARYGEADRRRRRPRSRPRRRRSTPTAPSPRSNRTVDAWRRRRRTVRRRGTGVSGASHGSDPVRRLPRSGRATRLVRTRRRDHGAADRGGRCVARPPAWTQRLPGAQARSATCHRRLVRFPEMEPLGARRRLPDPARVARSRRSPRRTPRRRGGARRCRRRDRAPPRVRSAARRHVDHTLDRGVPAVPAPPSPAGRRAGVRPAHRRSAWRAPAITGSASRPASAVPSERAAGSSDRPREPIIP